MQNASLELQDIMHRIELGMLAVPPCSNADIYFSEGIKPHRLVCPCWNPPQESIETRSSLPWAIDAAGSALADLIYAFGSYLMMLTSCRALLTCAHGCWSMAQIRHCSISRQLCTAHPQRTTYTR